MFKKQCVTPHLQPFSFACEENKVGWEYALMLPYEK